MATFYRIVKTQTPGPEDFRSNQARGLSPRGREIRQPELHAGISAYATEDDARSQARKFPQLGGLIARFRVPEDGSVRWAKTLGVGHYTLWGDPVDMAGNVETVVPV